MVESATEILLSKEVIGRRVKELAAIIAGEYKDKDLLVVGILKGAFIFMSDLIREMQIPCAVDFVRIASYGAEKETSGKITIKKDLETPVKGRDLLVVEDIVDTGLTLKSFVDMIQQRQPASLKVCVLLDKPKRRIVHFVADYVGFSIQDEFVVGYGLDYNEKYRYLPDVRVLRETA
jgi:hypoxanthine phosphoribosyltransferase